MRGLRDLFGRSSWEDEARKLFTPEGNIDSNINELFSGPVADAIPIADLKFRKSVPYDFGQDSWVKHLYADVMMTKGKDPSQKIYPVNPAIIAELIPRTMGLRGVLEKSWGARQDKGLPADLPIGAAVFDAQIQRGEVTIDFFNNEEAMEGLLKWILQDQKRKERFRYILENYVLSQTQDNRYSHVRNWLGLHDIGDSKPATMLDVGSSSGYALLPFLDLEKLSIIAMDRMPADYIPNRIETVEGIDFEERAELSERVKRLTGDAEAIPLEDESVDIINYNWVTPYIPETKIRKVFQEAKRVLKEKGIVFVCPLKSGDSNFLVLKKENGILSADGVYNT